MKLKSLKNNYKADHSLAGAGASPSEAHLESAASPAPTTLSGQFATALGQTLVRQFRFPPLLRGLVEAAIFATVFILAGLISLGIGWKSMLGPMVPTVLVMMFCMVASGVYRSEITHSILNLYIHSIYGFFLASFGFILLTLTQPAEYSQPKFIFFFLFFAFFVMNTLRPIISGTDFNDGGGRRNN